MRDFLANSGLSKPAKYDAFIELLYIYFKVFAWFGFYFILIIFLLSAFNVYIVYIMPYFILKIV